MEPSPEDKMELLAARANVARGRLSAALGALDRRRREVLDVPLQITKHLTFVGVVAGACITGVAAVAIYRAVTASRRRRYERWRMVRRVWNHPEQAAPEEGSLLGKLAKALLMVAARAVAARVMAEVAKRADAEPPALTDGGGAPPLDAE